MMFKHLTFAIASWIAVANGSLGAHLRAADDEPQESDVIRICQAASAGNVEEIQRLLNESPLLRNARNEAGFTALHYAAMHGRLEAVKILLVRMVDGDATQETFNGTPLQYAAHRGHLEVVELLLESGMEIDSRDANERTPLIWAVMGKRSEVIERLIEAGADLTLTNKGGWTPLHYAYQAGDEAIIQMLLEQGADPEIKNMNGVLPRDVPVKRDSPSD